MNRAFFNAQFSALMSVYTYAQKMPDAGQEVYWEMLQDIPEKNFHAGVKKCLATCKFFPTISELGEASLPTQKRLGRYNPHGESVIVLDWRAQVDEIKRRLDLPGFRQRRELDNAPEKAS